MTPTDMAAKLLQKAKERREMMVECNEFGPEYLLEEGQQAESEEAGATALEALPAKDAEIAGLIEMVRVQREALEEALTYIYLFRETDDGIMMSEEDRVICAYDIKLTEDALSLTLPAAVAQAQEMREKAGLLDWIITGDGADGRIKQWLNQWYGGRTSLEALRAAKGSKEG